MDGATPHCTGNGGDGMGGGDGEMGTTLADGAAFNILTIGRKVGVKPILAPLPAQSMPFQVFGLPKSASLPTTAEQLSRSAAAEAFGRGVEGGHVLEQYRRDADQLAKVWLNGFQKVFFFYIMVWCRKPIQNFILSK